MKRILWLFVVISATVQAQDFSTAYENYLYQNYYRHIGDRFSTAKRNVYLSFELAANKQGFCDASSQSNTTIQDSCLARMNAIMGTSFTSSDIPCSDTAVATPGGSSGQVQYNNSGSLGGLPKTSGDTVLTKETADGLYGSADPAGSDGDFQYNDNGSLGAAPLTTDGVDLNLGGDLNSNGNNVVVESGDQLQIGDKHIYQSGSALRINNPIGSNSIILNASGEDLTWDGNYIRWTTDTAATRAYARSVGGASSDGAVNYIQTSDGSGDFTASGFRATSNILYGTGTGAPYLDASGDGYTFVGNEGNGIYRSGSDTNTIKTSSDNVAAWSDNGFYIIDSLHCSDSVFLNYLTDAEGDEQWLLLSTNNAIIADSITVAAVGLIDDLPEISLYLKDTKDGELKYRLPNDKYQYGIKGKPSETIFALQWALEHNLRYIEKLEKRVSKLEILFVCSLCFLCIFFYIYCISGCKRNY